MILNKYNILQKFEKYILKTSLTLSIFLKSFIFEIFCIKILFSHYILILD